MNVSQAFTICLVSFFLILTVNTSKTIALDHEVSLTGTGHIAVFPNAGQGSKEHVITFLQVKPDWALIFEDSWQAVLSPRLRLGLGTSKYNFISFDDVYAEYVGNRFEVRAGYQTHFWGAVESFNLNDIFNQRDFRVDFFDPKENKIGEPAIRASGILGNQVLEVYYLPYFTPANLPDKGNPYNPLAGKFSIDQNRFYTNTAERLRPQFALRWKNTFGPADIGVLYFNGYERFPVLTLTPGAGNAEALYYEVQQVSGDLQMSLGSWLLKAEVQYLDTGIAGSFVGDSVLVDGTLRRRELVPDNLAAFVGGFEYTFFRVLGNSDLGIITEYLYNSQQDFDDVGFRPFQNDLFSAIRWSRNNLGDGELMAGVILDLTNGTQLWRLEYTERFFDRLMFMVYGEIIDAASEDPLASLEDSDNVALQFSYVY